MEPAAPSWRIRPVARVVPASAVPAVPPAAPRATAAANRMRMVRRERVMRTGPLFLRRALRCPGGSGVHGDGRHFPESAERPRDPTSCGDVALVRCVYGDGGNT